MKEHKIGWLNIPGYIPETWNPIVGCTKVSEGCEHCYAERMANRLASNPKTAKKYNGVIDNGKWSGMTNFDMDTIFNHPYWKKPRAFFVCSMGDLFHQTIPFHHIDNVMNLICSNPQHIYIVITKRPDRMAEYFAYLNSEMKDFEGYEAAPNLWLGVTAENQQRANERIPVLLSIPAAKRFVSIEPMLGAIKLQLSMNEDAAYCVTKGFCKLAGFTFPEKDNSLDWVIVGGETGPGARVLDIDWIENLSQQCKTENVPFFLKSFGSRLKENDQFITDEFRQFPKL
jgi:protein gp37